MRPIHIWLDAATSTNLVSVVLRRRAVDAMKKRDADLEDLVDRLLAFLASEPKITKDDSAVGHPFHGNQYVKVDLGPKPTSTVATVTKHAVHELLSSGHPWSIEELMKITGHENKTTMTSWMSMFKNSKTAGSKGVLNITKLPDGTYQVVPNAELKVPEIIAPIEKAMPAVKGTTPGKLLDITVPSEPMSKPKADAIYQVQMEAANLTASKYMKHSVEKYGFASNQQLQMAAELWKTAKHDAMAQWATNLKGTLVEPAPVLIFPEDQELMKDFTSALGDPQKIATAISEWKEATSKAKMGKTVAVAAEAVAKQKAAAPTTPPPGGPHSLSAPSYDEIVPVGFKSVDHADFETAPGDSASGFVKKAAALTKALHDEDETAVGNKKNVDTRLNERLKDSKHFQWMKAERAKISASSLVAQLVSAWAGSSGDGQSVSVAAQLAVRDAFKMDKAGVETKAFHFDLETTADENKVYKNAAASLGIDYHTPAALHSFKEGMKDFVLAQWHETQDFFKSKGIEEVHVMRGMKIAGGAPKKVKTKLQPASSFSSNFGTAHAFAGGSSVFIAKVPVTQVLGTFVTGYGCTSEHELVVLNHSNLEMIQTAANQALNITTLASQIKKEGALWKK